MMGQRQGFPPTSKVGRAKMAAMAIVTGAALLTVSGVVVPTPALAWWRNGVWVGGPGYYPYRPYYGPRPYYYAPPIVVAPPPVYYAPPPVVYAAPPPPPVYYPPQPLTYPVAARTCYAPPLNCPMEVPRSPGSACYCSDSTGNRSYGTAQ
jgi:hypothetical protein